VVKRNGRSKEQNKAVLMWSKENEKAIRIIILGIWVPLSYLSCVSHAHIFWLSCCDAVSTKYSLAYYNIHYLACKTGYLIPHLSKISAITVNWPSDSSMHGSIVHSSIISLAEIENLHWEVKEWSCGILRGG